MWMASSDPEETKVGRTPGSVVVTVFDVLVETTVTCEPPPARV